MFGQAFAVVGNHDDQRVAQARACAGHEAPEGGVRQAHAGGVVGFHRGCFVSRVISLAVDPAVLAFVERDIAPLLGHVAVGGVGIVEVEPDEGGGAGLLVEPGERGIHRVLARAKHACRRVVGVEARKSGQVRGHQGRGHERPGGVARLAQLERQGAVAVDLPKRDGVSRRSEFRGVAPGKERQVGGARGGHGGERRVVDEALVGQRVEVGRGARGGAVGADGILADGVEGDQDDRRGRGPAREQGSQEGQQAARNGQLRGALHGFSPV